MIPEPASPAEAAPLIQPPAGDVRLRGRRIGASGLLLLLPGLAGIGLGAFSWWAASSAESNLDKQVGSWVGVMLISVSLLPAAMGLRLLKRPVPRAAVIGGALLSGAYGLPLGSVVFLNQDVLVQRSPNAWLLVIALVVAIPFLLATLLLVSVLLTARAGNAGSGVRP
jgi:hypothetical protein